MNDNCFFDTNILVYMQDISNKPKQHKARDLFYDCVNNNKAFISTQVLQEFYNITVNKLKQHKTEIKKIIHVLSETLPTIQVTTQIIEKAIDINIRYQFSFWDSLIIASAIHAQCTVLYSEDLNSGQTVEGVKIINPFDSIK